MIIVSDTSPITNLIQINALSLLQQLYGRVLIPEAVYNELCTIPAQHKLLREISWIEVINVSEKDSLSELLKVIDLGEAEAILLAIELKPDYLLIDEQKGRTIARKNGIPITGILGVLIQAKQRQLIPTVKPLMDQLISQAGFWIKKPLYEYILVQVDE